MQWIFKNLVSLTLTLGNLWIRPLQKISNEDTSITTARMLLRRDTKAIKSSTEVCISASFCYQLSPIMGRIRPDFSFESKRYSIIFHESIIIPDSNFCGNCKLICFLTSVRLASTSPERLSFSEDVKKNYCHIKCVWFSVRNCVFNIFELSETPFLRWHTLAIFTLNENTQDNKMKIQNWEKPWFFS